MTDAHSGRYAAMVEFIACFPSISGPLPISIHELSDGIILFEALSDIAPDHFDPSTVSRGNTNWALKANNLRKLVRKLESYFHGTLSKTTNFEALSDLISTIARNDDPDSIDCAEGIAQFIEIITAAAVTCEDKGRYIGWIMGMEGDNQMLMKGIIESSLGRLEDLDESMTMSPNKDSSLHGSDDHDQMVGDDDMSNADSFEAGAEMSGLFRNAMHNLDSITQGMDVTVGSHSEYSNGNSQGGGNPMDYAREREELRSALAEAKRELLAREKHIATLVEDGETTQNKLRALSTDLQERLQIRQEELLDTEEKLMRTKRALEDAEGKVSDLEESNVTLEDELDIARSKAIQLKKAEATVVAYRKKLEGAGVMNQQMNDLENQSAKYLGQIVELEMEAKKIPELQKSLDKTARELKKTQAEKNDIADQVITKTTAIAKLKTQLSASVTAKKSAEEEVAELRAIQESDGNAADEDPNIGGLSLQSVQSVTEVREKVMRLEIENKTLKKELKTVIEAAAALPTETVATASSENSGVADESTVKNLESEINKLEAALKKKDAATAKLAADKDKLEAYTKRTLSKFQEKYLVALQECKAKLKEKHDKIEALEMRSAAEKSNQKKEEKLLSSAIYELGLTIMQQKLKSR